MDQLIATDIVNLIETCAVRSYVPSITMTKLNLHSAAAF